MVKWFLLIYLFITSIMLMVAFHEATHVVLSWNHHPSRVCVPVLEDHHHNTAYVDYDISYSKAPSEVPEVMISLIPWVLFFFIILRYDIIM